MWSGKCPVGEMSVWGSALVEKCPLGEVPGREVSVRELSVGELSSRGTVRIPVYS